MGLVKLKSWGSIASNEGRGYVNMRIPFDVVEEDRTVKIPLIWDGTDIKLLENVDGLIDAVRGKKVLEIGGGSGYLGYFLSHFAARYDVYETFPPYIVVYAVYVQPHVVRERLPLNYIVKYVTDEDLPSMDHYDVGIYSGFSDDEHILSMLEKKCDKVIHIVSEFTEDYKKRLLWRLVKR